VRVAIAGAGNVGKFVARDLAERGHDVILIERNKQLIMRESAKIDCTWVHADACEPFDLQGIGLDECDVMVAATGDDEDNLVVALLAKQEFGIPRVLARVNHPNNQWLFNQSWGVDVAVSPPQLLTGLVEEAVTVGDLVRLLRLEQGKVALLELTLAEGSPADGKTIGELKMPPDCSLVAIVRDRHVITPTSETPLHAGDEVLALAAPEAESDLLRALSAQE
jgi:trk system potassium uptake protein TrkA